MKFGLTLSVILLLPLSALRAEELARLSMESAEDVSPRIAADSEVKSEGEASVRVETDWPTTVHLGSVENLDAEAARLVYRAKVKSELEEGTAFLEMWVKVGDGQYFSRGLNDSVEGAADWTELQTPFILEPGQRADTAWLNLVINGRGTVWIDDVVLENTPLE